MTREVIHAAQYPVLEMMAIPEEVSEDIECPGNDTGRIINPDYHPKLKQWLQENGHATECYIGWWSW